MKLQNIISIAISTLLSGIQDWLLDEKKLRKMSAAQAARLPLVARMDTLGDLARLEFDRRAEAACKGIGP